MRGRRGIPILFSSLFLVLLSLVLVDLLTGTIRISPGDLFRHISGRELLDQPQEIILKNFRIPRVLTALLAGAALPLCGLQMQILFRNPLAGPYVLGISSGASLGAALVVLGAGAGMLVSPWSLNLAAWAGAGLVMLMLLLVSFRIRDGLTLLILGIMFSSGLAAVISILQYFSGAEALKSFVIWSMGSLGSVSGKQLWVMGLSLSPLIFLSLGMGKLLNTLVLGEDYARTMGVRMRTSRALILFVTSIMAGTITAFCGPVGFIGIAVPHISRFLFRTSDNRVLLPGTMLAGMTILVMSDLISQLPGSERILPINAVTSLIGIPVVIWLVIMNRKARMI